MDLRVGHPINLRDHWNIMPFAEFFNLFNRNNPGANYVTNVASLPVTCADPTDSSCTNILPTTNPNQFRVPSGGLGDFFGPAPPSTCHSRRNSAYDLNSDGRRLS